MVPKKVTDFLKKQKIPYSLVDHKKVFTAYDAAATLKLKLNEIVKSLVVKMDKNYYLIALPADKNLDFGLLKKAAKAMGIAVKKIEIPGEKVITKILKVKPGQITGFGPLHKIKSVVDTDLKKVKEVIVSGGSLTQSIRMKISDYLKAIDGVVAPIGKKKIFVLPKAPQVKKKSTGKKKKLVKKSTKKPGRSRATGKRA